ncbi:MAG: hypothetical protein GY711_31055 [bacterium]|nr:hypothetical protein [bacterium]
MIIQNSVVQASAIALSVSASVPAFNQCHEALLEPPLGAQVSQFGFVESIAISGDTIVVGAWNDHEQGFRAGSAYVFKRSGVSWKLEQRLRPNIPDPSFLSMGVSVALDGDTLFASTLRDVDDGSVLVFERDDSTWTLAQELFPTSGFPGNELFGSSLHLSGDDAIVVATGEARFYQYRSIVGTWVETASYGPEVLAPWSFDPSTNMFASDIAVDGNRMLLANLQGPVYILECDGSGAWAATAEVSAPGVQWAFHVVDLEGDTLVVGSALDQSNSGSVYVFERTPTGWSLAQTLTASDSAPFRGFGVSVSLSGDRLLVGSNIDATLTDRGGSAYIFHRVDSVWMEVDKFFPATPIFWGGFGTGCKLSNDEALVVAPGFVNSGTPGTVHVFDLDADQGTPFCAAELNSTGMPASLSAHGSRRAALDCLTFDVTQLPPGEVGYFIAANHQGDVPFPAGSDGRLCLANPLLRLADFPQTASATGDVNSSPNLSGLGIVDGDTWSFQYWTRDGTTSNFSNGLAVSFRTGGTPHAQFPSSIETVDEAAAIIELEVSLSDPWTSDLSVPFSISGTATNLVDFRLATPSPIMIPAGRTSTTLSLLIAPDNIQEADETIVIDLEASGLVELGSQTRMTVTVTDDD